MTRGISAYNPIPVVLLAQLGVDQRDQGAGLGRLLLRDAMLRTVDTANLVGVHAFMVEAESEMAAEFYLKQAEFFRTAEAPRRLFLPMKELRASLAGRGSS